MSNKKKTLGILTTLVSLFSLTSCNTEMIQDRIETTVNNMLPNLWITLLQLGLFILVAILFIVIAYKPLKKKLNERADYIEKNIKESENKALEAEEKIKEANRIVLNGQKKAGEIIQRAEKTAENKASELEKQLAETIEKQKQSAHNDIENERNKMLKEAKSEIISTAISTSKEILKRNVTVSDNDEYVNKFIEELNKGNSNE